MSKKSKKTKFNKVEVQWAEDNLMLPTVAAAIPQRRSFGGPMGGGRGGYGGYGQRDPESKPFDDTERGPWRRGPSGGGGGGGGSGGSGPSNSFGSNRRERGPPSFNNFRRENNDSNDMRSPPSADLIGASENDTNWRGGRKKEQPKIQSILNTNRVSATSNVNPWRRENTTDTPPRGPPRGPSRTSFGGGGGDRPPRSSRSSEPSTADSSPSFSRSGFGARVAPSRPVENNGSSRGPNRYGSSKFGPSKFGGASSVKSKFNTGGGFAASAMKNIDSGTTRLTYSKNNRFSGIMDDPVTTTTNKRDGNKSASLEAPSKVSSSRFGAIMSHNNNNTNKAAASSQAPESSAFPGLSTASNVRQREEKTVEQMMKEIKKDNQRQQMILMEQEQREREKSERNKAQNKKQKQKQGASSSTKAQNKPSRQATNKPSQSQQASKANAKKQNQAPKVDKKLVRKFNKECLGQNRAIEINADTERMIVFGLSQRENILQRNEDNYEKIAQLLVGVILNDANIKRGGSNKKQTKPMDLNAIYDIIYHQSSLFEAQSECLGLVLEILSLIEMKKTCLGVVQMVDAQQIMDRYLRQTPDIQEEDTMKEFEEYGLQYAYPLHEDVVSGVKQEIANEISLAELVGYLQRMKKKQMIYSNYVTLDLIVTYVLNRFYLSQCVEDEEQNEELAKSLILSETKAKSKTDFAKIMGLLHCKTDDQDNKNDAEDEEDEDEDEEEEEEEEEEDDEDVDSHSLLILSSIISCSGELKNNNRGLVSVLKIMELARLIKYNAIRKYVQCDDDEYTQHRLSALSKLTDWIADLDARQARLEMEKDSDEDYDDDGVDNSYVGGNLLAQRKHKTAADYEQISYVDVE